MLSLVIYAFAAFAAFLLACLSVVALLVVADEIRACGRRRRRGSWLMRLASIGTKSASAPTVTPPLGRSDGPTETTRLFEAAFSSGGVPGDRLAGAAILQARASLNNCGGLTYCGNGAVGVLGLPLPSVPLPDRWLP